MSSPTLRYTYFDAFTSRGSPARVFMVLNNIAFTDDVVGDFDKYNVEKFPQATLPVLDVDGHVIGGSNVILSYLSRLAGQADDPLRAAQVDSVNDMIEALMARFNFYGEAEDKAAYRKTLDEKILPVWFSRVESYVKGLSGERPAGGLIFGGDQITTADIRIALLVRYMKTGNLDGVSATITDKYEYLNGIHRAVFKNKIVADYLVEHKVDPKL